MKVIRPVKRKAALLAALAAVAAALFSVAFIRAYGLLDTALDGRRMRDAYGETLTYFQLREQMFAGQADTRVSGWLSLVQSEEVSIRSERGTLAATHYAPVGHTENTPWALVVHGGLGTDRSQVIDIACALSLAGYHVLTPDLYAHGRSEGKISSLGLREADDAKSWIGWILAQDADAQIVLYGVDEGGIACLIAGAESPAGVAAVAVDSVYLSVEDRLLQLAQETHDDLTEIDRLLLRAAFRAVHGVPADEGGLERIAADYPLPLLLVHGTGDEDVPAWHAEDIARAAGENAELYFAEGAGHGMSRFLDPQKYSEILLGFFAGALEDD